MADQIVLSDGDSRLYERGASVAHSSDDSGMCDVGVSVGLGGWMLYAGEVPHCSNWGLCLYPQGKGGTIDIALGIDPELGREIVDKITIAIAHTSGSSTDERRYTLTEAVDVLSNEWLHVCDVEAHEIANRISGPKGTLNRCPDGVQVLEDAERIFKAAAKYAGGPAHTS